MKLDKILVPSDLSAEALRPIDAVLDLARQQDAQVTVLHVVSDLTIVPHGAPLAPPMGAYDVQDQVARARQALEDQCATYADDVRLSLEVGVHSDPAQAVVEFAREGEYDLIALSTHGRTGIRRLALGSIAELILRRSEVPVLSFHRRGDAG